MSLSTVNGKIYAIGGNSALGTPALQTVEVYDPLVDEWTVGAAMPTGRFAPATGVVDGKIYVMDAEGNVVVLAAGDEFRVLARVALDSYPSRSTIVADDGQLLIRTAEHLYCIGAAR